MSDNDLVKAGAMTPDQVKAVRALLGWSVERLAARSGTSVTMVTVFEQTGRVVSLHSNNRMGLADPVTAICATLDAARIEFISESGGVDLELREPDLSKAGSVTPVQLAAARKLLRWSRARLAAYSNTTPNLIALYERSGKIVRRYATNANRLDNPLGTLRGVLERAGVEFVEQDSGAGVRLRKLDP